MKRSFHKYRAKKVEGSSLTDGYSFSSQLERGVYLLLKAMEQSGEVRVEQVQDKILLSCAQIEYRPDFRITDLKLGQPTWVEAKGFETSDWRLKRRLWICCGPGPLWIYKGTALKPRLHEVLVPENRCNQKR